MGTSRRSAAIVRMSCTLQFCSSELSLDVWLLVYMTIGVYVLLDRSIHTFCQFCHSCACQSQIHSDLSDAPGTFKRKLSKREKKDLKKKEKEAKLKGKENEKPSEVSVLKLCDDT